MLSSRGLDYGNTERFEFNQKFAFVAIYFLIQPIAIGSKQSILVDSFYIYTEDSQPSVGL